jgi:hypothetical protein
MRVCVVSCVYSDVSVFIYIYMRCGHQACLDVTIEEPLEDSSELWEMPNVMITPHTGGETAMCVIIWQRSAPLRLLLLQLYIMRDRSSCHAIDTCHLTFSRVCTTTLVCSCLHF